MSIGLNEENDGEVLAVHVRGNRTAADFVSVVSEFERLVRQRGKVRVLFDRTGFHGWEAHAVGDTKFAIKRFSDIERLAMVGETKWQHGMATLCQPFTTAPIRYFKRADASGVRQWLIET